MLVSARFRPPEESIASIGHGIHQHGEGYPPSRLSLAVDRVRGLVSTVVSVTGPICRVRIHPRAKNEPEPLRKEVAKAFTPGVPNSLPD